MVRSGSVVGLRSGFRCGLRCEFWALPFTLRFILPLSLLLILGVGVHTARGEVKLPRASIALPGGSLHMTQGLIGTFSGGKSKDLQEDQSLFQWQGEAAYAYKTFLTAGAGFRLKAGEPSSAEQKVENRYFISVRFHKNWTHMDLYAGPQLGLDNLNLTSSSFSDTAKLDPLRQTFSNTGASVGFEFGFGYKPFGWGGLTYGHRLEYSLANLSGSKRDQRTFNLRTLPGLNLDLLYFFPKMAASVQAFYLFAEYQNGFLFFFDQRRRVESAWLAGFSLGF